MIPANAKAGDFVLVHMPGETGDYIHYAQMLNGDGNGTFEHAALYLGNGQLIEAQPSGAKVADAHKYDTAVTMWSTGIINPDTNQRMAIRAAGLKYQGVGYSYEDYVALTMHRFGVDTAFLEAYIKSTHHMICSQLVDQSFTDGGYHLFQDNRWAGFVTPGSLWQLLEGKTK